MLRNRFGDAPLYRVLIEKLDLILTLPQMTSKEAFDLRRKRKRKLMSHCIYFLRSPTPFDHKQLVKNHCQDFGKDICDIQAGPLSVVSGTNDDDES